MHERSTHLDHDEADLLLPWFVNNTLADAERQRVLRHLASCTACQQSVELLRAMRCAAQTDAAVPMVPAPRAAELISAIAANEPRQTSMNGWRVVALAASVAAILLVTMLVADRLELAPKPETRFETATSARTATAMDYVMAVEFEPGTTAIVRHQALAEYEVTEIVAEGEADTYRIMLRLPASTLEDLERVTKEMESHADVLSVRVLALQLPMR